MNPVHHPDEEALLAYAMGTVSAGGSLTIRAHVEVCAHCRSTLRFLDLLGGALMGSLESEPLAPDAVERALSALTSGPTDATTPEPGPLWPGLLANLQDRPWQDFAPGLLLAAIDGDFAADEIVCLLKGDAGVAFPPHGHENVERFVMLEGSFGIGDTIYRPGDYFETDSSVTHAPFVPSDGGCLCLLALEGELVITDPTASIATP